MLKQDIIPHFKIHGGISLLFVSSGRFMFDHQVWQACTGTQLLTHLLIFPKSRVANQNPPKCPIDSSADQPIEYNLTRTTLCKVFTLTEFQHHSIFM